MTDHDAAAVKQRADWIALHLDCKHLPSARRLDTLASWLPLPPSRGPHPDTNRHPHSQLTRITGLTPDLAVN